ncbi:putative ferric-chelate reductase 1 isoform X1 [Branchiostoma floridae]|uniref:Ferric-chelate reductase 1 isoform X1 n=1 Tax=Branchiostoma floridae TaxID=7739 RepID=A0A9J7LXC4_BRAFL|nr:putative ferric-chelate reductase 1 isoform X1 [Branchiostoma floridae]
MSWELGTASGLLLALVVVASLLSGGEAYGTGAPLSACTSQQPGHYGFTAQTSASPYSLTVSSSEYTPGQTLTVQITGADFQGFLIQARKVGTTTAVGFFTSLPSGTKSNNCDNAVASGDNTATHSSTAAKRDLTLTWSAPENQAGQGTIEFVATVAQQKATYWMGITSAQLSEATSGDTTTHAQGTTRTQADQTTGGATGATPTGSSQTGSPMTTESSTPGSGATMATTFNLLLLAIPAFLAKLLM